MAGKPRRMIGGNNTMPDLSKVSPFVKALKTGMTHTTKVLDVCDYAKYKDELKIPGALSPLPDWAIKELSKSHGTGKNKVLGLKPKELDHINDWPPAQLDQVRKAILAALGPPTRTLQFFWELTTQSTEGTTVQGLDKTGDIIITFLSPRALLKAKKVKGIWDIKVGVTKPTS